MQKGTHTQTRHAKRYAREKYITYIHYLARPQTCYQVITTDNNNKIK